MKDFPHNHILAVVQARVPAAKQVYWIPEGYTSSVIVQCLGPTGRNGEAWKPDDQIVIQVCGDDRNKPLCTITFRASELWTDVAAPPAVINWYGVEEAMTWPAGTRILYSKAERGSGIRSLVLGNGQTPAKLFKHEGWDRFAVVNPSRYLEAA